MPRRLLLLSNSTNHGFGYLEHCHSALENILKRSDISRITFVPYALRNHDDYAAKVKLAFQKLDINVESLHEIKDEVKQIENSEAIFIGGGNTFLLLKSLYDKSLIEPIRKRVLQDGIPYIGSSAGTNAATVSICTTNDMPIVYPPSFSALNLIPFNINPHYADADAGSKHMGETREERIKQYHEIPEMPPVLGLRENSWLDIDGNDIMLCGGASAILFVSNKKAANIEVGSRLDFLLEQDA